MSPVGLRGGAVLAALIVSTSGCRQSSSGTGGTPESLPPGTLVQVNGAAITEADVELVSRVRGGHGGSPPAAARRDQVIDTLIDQELAAQKAVELGLDQDPAYREELARLTAEVNALRRQRLSTAYHRHLGGAVKVSEADARAHYEANAERFATELHVRQVLMRDRASAEVAQTRLQAGTPFEEVGSDLGWLRWQQVPDAWREPLAALAPGATTGILEGPNRRFWILQLVERRAATAVSFETERDALIERLTEERAVQEREEAVRKLRAGARIVREAAPESLRLASP